MNADNNNKVLQQQGVREMVLDQSPGSNNRMSEWSLSSVKPVNCPLLGIPEQLSNVFWELMVMFA